MARRPRVPPLTFRRVVDTLEETYRRLQRLRATARLPRVAQTELDFITAHVLAPDLIRARRLQPPP